MTFDNLISRIPSREFVLTFDTKDGTEAELALILDRVSRVFFDQDGIGTSRLFKSTPHYLRDEVMEKLGYPDLDCDGYSLVFSFET